MDMNDVNGWRREQLDQLTALTGKYKVTEDQVAEELRDRTQAWDRIVTDGLDAGRTQWEGEDAAFRNAGTRTEAAYGYYLDAIAADHAGCRRKDCRVCTILRHAIAYRLAYLRFEVARHDKTTGSTPAP